MQPDADHVLRARPTPRLQFPRSSSTSTRGDEPLSSLFPLNDSQRPRLDSDVSEIHSPTPRRHLLERSASQQWLRTPPLSPVSSRAVSPMSTFNRSPTNSLRRLSFQRPGSFGSMMENDPSQDAASAKGRPGLRERRSSASLAHKTHEAPETSMGRRWLRWMHKRGLKTWIIPALILFSTLIKFCVGLGSYSGQNTPPMYGDYEAQRHWMELTIHLPTREWYTYDLQYWGLDYPPLTAYVSWLCGIIGSWVNPSWFALGSSRGVETPGSKLYMRLTVIVWDALVYVPALVMFSRTWQGSRSKRTQNLALLVLVLQPALLLVDSGHFQYNSVMLGLTLLAMNFFATGQDLLGSVCFVLSLGFKQMALYYAPAIGTYLLAKCIYLGPSLGTNLFLRLGLVTSLTFLLLFLPFLPPFSSRTAILDPVSRIFPFARGLFEDKVANFWCASNVVFKWRNWASAASLVRLSAALTALGFIPSVFVMLQAGVKLYAQGASSALTSGGAGRRTQTPILPLLPYALLNSSMSFFLFSFQVHEKTILLPLMPITVLLSAASVDSTTFAWGVLVNNVAVFSMWPLLKRDGLGAQYIALVLLWNRLIGYNPLHLRPKSFIQLLSLGVYASMLGLHLLELFITPPSRYPDLFPVLNVLISTPVFVLTWLWSMKCSVEVSWALGGLGDATARRKGSTVGDRVHVSVVPEEDGDEGQVEERTHGAGRPSGSRASSLGFAQARRRPPASSLSRRGPASVGVPE